MHAVHKLAHKGNTDWFLLSHAIRRVAAKNRRMLQQEIGEANTKKQKVVFPTNSVCHFKNKPLSGYTLVADS